MQNYIDQVFDLGSDVGMSKTVKGHGTEAHLVQQMRRAPGGLKHFDESWMEQYHQTGYKFDMKYRNMGSELAKAKVRASADRRNTKPGTVAAGEKCLAQHSRGKRKATVGKQNEKKRVKEERRTNAFD